MLKIDNLKRDNSLDHILNGYFFLELKGILMPYLQNIFNFIQSSNYFPMQWS